eukprot:7658930-Heterocapsa_arctica.AAC.1
MGARTRNDPSPPSQADRCYTSTQHRRADALARIAAASRSEFRPKRKARAAIRSLSTFFRASSR